MTMPERSMDKDRFLMAKVSDILIAAGDKVKTDLIKAGIGNENLFYVLRPGVKDFELLDKEVISKDDMIKYCPNTFKFKHGPSNFTLSSLILT
jgi:hypothetical protein